MIILLFRQGNEMRERNKQKNEKQTNKIYACLFIIFF